MKKCIKLNKSMDYVKVHLYFHKDNHSGKELDIQRSCVVGKHKRGQLILLNLDKNHMEIIHIILNKIRDRVYVMSDNLNLEIEIKLEEIRDYEREFFHSR